MSHLQQKQQDPSADTSALEAEIDRMVYDLYGLTEEEVGIVEDSVWGNPAPAPDPWREYPPADIAEVEGF